MIVADFPADWKTVITVHRGGGLDRKGNPLPGSDHQVDECMIGWRSTEDPVDRSDLVTDDAIMYVDSPSADIQAGDRVTIPPSPNPSIGWPEGEFRVDASPKPWQLGLEVPLTRGG